MRSPVIAVVALLMVGMLSGCMSEGKYRDMEIAYRKSQEDNTRLQSRLAELDQQIAAMRGQGMDDAKRMEALLAERDDLVAKLSEFDKKYADLANRPLPSGEVVKLDANTDKALRDFAAENSDIVEYDAALGMVKFRSDLTFKLGSDDLSPTASSTIAKLAGILNNPVTSRYEVRVVGHTDSVPIKKATTKAEHPTNWHLSVHRAIAVRDALASAGVPDLRTGVAGYGPYRPVVQNTRSGAEKNRRVEIYLVPMSPVNEAYIGNVASTPAPTKAAPVASSTEPLRDIPLK
ncbi:MAG: OmpA family protein [Phycisphaera sp.]|nr:OmpA family protein [Phycisphaera sp.]